MHCLCSELCCPDSSLFVQLLLSRLNISPYFSVSGLWWADHRILFSEFSFFPQGYAWLSSCQHVETVIYTVLNLKWATVANVFPSSAPLLLAHLTFPESFACTDLIVIVSGSICYTGRIFPWVIQWVLWPILWSTRIIPARSRALSLLGLTIGQHKQFIYRPNF